MDYDLPIAEHWVWYRALITNDVGTATNVLDSATNECCLLDGTFRYEQPDKFTEQEVKGIDLLLTRPMSLAIFFASESCVQLLLDRGTSINEVEANGNNLLHVLAYAASTHKDKEAKYIELYGQLKKWLPLKKLEELLHQENADNLRPLEMAGAFRIYGVTQTIFETNGIYRFPQGNIGITTAVLYDITDYEMGGERVQKSPLRLLTNALQEDLDRPTLTDIVKSPWITEWQKAKDFQFAGFVLFWFALRIFYIFLYAMALGDITPGDPTNPAVIQMFTTMMGMNATCTAVGNGMTYVLVKLNATGYPLMATGIISLGMFLFDITELSIHIVAHVRGNVSGMLKMCRKCIAGGALVQNSFYRGIMFAQAVYTVYLLIVARGNLWPTGELNDTLQATFYTIATVFNFWSLLFFLQALPLISHFVITFQRMLAEMLKFMLLYILISLSFSHTFYTLVTFGCQPFGLSYLYQWYVTFLMSLNIHTQPKLQTPGMTNGYMILHVVYVLIVAVLMINFLIAVMSNTVTIISSNKTCVKRINQIAVLLILERRLGWFLATYLPRLYYRTYIRCEGKVYLKCFEQLRVDDAHDMACFCIRGERRNLCAVNGKLQAIDTTGKTNRALTAGEPTLVNVQPI